MRYLLFDIHERSTGRTFRIWSDGYLDGFADDSIIENRAAPLLDALLGALHRVRGLSAASVEIADRVQGMSSDPKLTGEGTEAFGGILSQLPPVPAKSTG